MEREGKNDKTIIIIILNIVIIIIIILWFYSQIQALAASMKLSVSPKLLDLGQPAGLLGWVINPPQGPYRYTNTEKRTHNTNIKRP
jgi:hypothetical protein